MEKHKYTYYVLMRPDRKDRKDRNRNGGGKIVYVNEGLIAKRILEYENINIETICIEITISKRK